MKDNEKISKIHEPDENKQNKEIKNLEQTQEDSTNTKERYAEIKNDPNFQSLVQGERSSSNTEHLEDHEERDRKIFEGIKDPVVLDNDVWNQLMKIAYSDEPQINLGKYLNGDLEENGQKVTISKEEKDKIHLSSCVANGNTYIKQAGQPDGLVFRRSQKMDNE